MVSPTHLVTIVSSGHGDLVQSDLGLVLLGGGVALGVLVHSVAVRRQTVASLDTVEDPAVRHAGNLSLLGVAVLVSSRTSADLTVVMVDLTEKYEREERLTRTEVFSMSRTPL